MVDYVRSHHALASKAATFVVGSSSTERVGSDDQRGIQKSASAMFQRHELKEVPTRRPQNS